MNIMERILETIKAKYLYELFDNCTRSAFLYDISNAIFEKFPNITKYVYMKNKKEIHLDGSFFKRNNGVINFIPCIYPIKEGYFYDVYIDNAPVGQMSFMKTFEDPMKPGYPGIGYDVTTRPLFIGDKDILCDLVTLKED